MKIDRLIGILSILLQEEKVTAPRLAEKFEVSRRTINRDIEALCKAGIPVRTAQGAGGGIRIMDGYRLDRTILSSKEMQMILAGLRSLDSVSGGHSYAQLMEKIKAGSSDYISANESILIDLSSWNKDALASKMEQIQDAIEFGKIIKFRYYAPGGDSERSVEPYFLVFQWSSWYVYGYCRLRSDYRLFKLNRMTDIAFDGNFEKRSGVPMPDLCDKNVFSSRANIKAVFDPSMKWHLIETYGAESFTELSDGTLLFEQDDMDEEWMLSWLLSFRDQVTVLEPESIREKLLDVASRLTEKYRKEGEKMASKREYLDFVLGQLSEVEAGMEQISYRAMMGEYLLYYRDRLFGGIYDDRFLVRITPASKALLADAPEELPYDGAKPMLLVTELEDKDFLRELILAMYEELPETTKKSRGTGKNTNKK